MFLRYCMLLLIIFVNIPKASTLLFGNSISTNNTELSSAIQPIQHLYDAYRYRTFNKILPWTTGNFQNQMNQIILYQTESDRGVPDGIFEISKHLTNMKVENQVCKGDKAIVMTNWFLEYEATPVHPKKYTKVIKREFHLLKVLGQWKISDSKIIGETYYINKD